MVVQLILEGLDELWHYESDLLVTELGQLLNREKSDFDVTELSVQQSNVAERALLQVSCPFRALGSQACRSSR